jgi:predicted DNA-binding transcriptional regulator YafY
MVQHAQYERLAFIEMLALWKGYVRNSDVVRQFGISRQQVYKDIGTYQSLHSDILHKCRDGSYQRDPASFLHYFDGSLDTFLHWLLTEAFYVSNQLQTNQAYSLALPARSSSPQIIATLTQAIRKQLSVEVGYVSLSNPETDGRIFSPHVFVKAGGRWHVRGYCEKSQDYRDLVLSRFRGEAVIEGTSEHTSIHDAAWNTFITIILAPDQRLTTAQQDVLINDYQMVNGQLELRVRAALADYLLKEMQVNTKYLDGKPEAQQLVLVNRDDIKQWLFNS